MGPQNWEWEIQWAYVCHFGYLYRLICCQKKKNEIPAEFEIYDFSRTQNKLAHVHLLSVHTNEHQQKWKSGNIFWQSLMRETINMCKMSWCWCNEGVYCSKTYSLFSQMILCCQAKSNLFKRPWKEINRLIIINETESLQIFRIVQIHFYIC